MSIMAGWTAPTVALLSGVPQLAGDSIGYLIHKM
jgi:hypothetical protein